MRAFRPRGTIRRGRTRFGFKKAGKDSLRGARQEEAASGVHTLPPRMRPTETRRQSLLEQRQTGATNSKALIVLPHLTEGRKRRARTDRSSCIGRLSRQTLTRFWGKGRECLPGPGSTHADSPGKNRKTAGSSSLRCGIAPGGAGRAADHSVSAMGKWAECPAQSAGADSPNLASQCVGSSP